MSLPTYKVGQEIWIGHHRDFRGHLAKITKVGRKWVTFEHCPSIRLMTGKFEIGDLHPWVDNGKYSKEWKVFWIQRDHGDLLLADSLWTRFQQKLSCKRPYSVAREDIREAAQLLGIKL